MLILNHLTYEKMESEYLAYSFCRSDGIMRVWAKLVLHPSCQSAGSLCLNHYQQCQMCSWQL